MSSITCGLDGRLAGGMLSSRTVARRGGMFIETTLEVVWKYGIAQKQAYNRIEIGRVCHVRGQI